MLRQSLIDTLRNPPHPSIYLYEKSSSVLTRNLLELSAQRLGITEYERQVKNVTLYQDVLEHLVRLYNLVQGV